MLFYILKALVPLSSKHHKGLLWICIVSIIQFLLSNLTAFIPTKNENQNVIKFEKYKRFVITEAETT